MAIFALKQTVDFYRNQDIPLYMCFLDAKKAFDRVNHWTLANKLLDRNVPLHIVKLFIFWYREQEFMVRWCNSPSMTLHCRRYVAHMLGLMTLYTTQRKQYVCWSGQNNHRVSFQQEPSSEMRNLTLSRNFVT